MTLNSFPPQVHYSALKNIPKRSRRSSKYTRELLLQAPLLCESQSTLSPSPFTSFLQFDRYQTKYPPSSSSTPLRVEYERKKSSRPAQPRLQIHHDGALERTNHEMMMGMNKCADCQWENSGLVIMIVTLRSDAFGIKIPL